MAGARQLPLEFDTGTGKVIVGDGSDYEPFSLPPYTGQGAELTLSAVDPDTGVITLSGGADQKVVPPQIAGKLQEVITKLNTSDLEITGGKVVLGTGTYTVVGPVAVSSGSAENIRNIEVIGNQTGSVIDFSSSPAGTNGFEFSSGSNFAKISLLCIRGAKLAGIRLKSLGSTIWGHVEVSNTRISNCVNGILADEGITGSFRKVFSQGNSGAGFKFNGPHTSLHFDNSYADGNGAHGFEINRTVYSTLTSTGSDNNTLHGYSCSGTSNTVFSGAGSEVNGRAGFAFEGSAATPGTAGSVLINTLNGCMSYSNNMANAGFPNHIYIKSSDNVKNVVRAKGNKSYAPANGAVDGFVDGIGAVLIDEDNDFPAGCVSRNGGYIYHVPRPIVVRSKSVTAATPLVSLRNMQGNTGGAFGGTITVLASPNDPSTDSARNTSTYQLLVNFGNVVTIVEIAKAGLTTGSAANWPSFTWSVNGSNQLVATPVGSTSGVFFFEVLSGGFMREAEI